MFSAIDAKGGKLEIDRSFKENVFQTTRQYGFEIFKKNYLYAYMLDCFPGEKEFLMLMKVIYEDGIYPKLAAFYDNCENDRMRMKNIMEEEIKRLEAKFFWSEEVARFCVEIFGNLDAINNITTPLKDDITVHKEETVGEIVKKSKDNDSFSEEYNRELYEAIEECKKLRININKILANKNAFVRGKLSCSLRNGILSQGFKIDFGLQEVAVLELCCLKRNANYEGVLLFLELVTIALSKNKNLMIFCNESYDVISNYYLNLNTLLKGLGSIEKETVSSRIKYFFNIIKEKGNVFLFRYDYACMGLCVTGANAFELDLSDYHDYQKNMDYMIGFASKVEVNEDKVAIYQGGANDHDIAGIVSFNQKLLNELEKTGYIEQAQLNEIRKQINDVIYANIDR